MLIDRRLVCMVVIFVTFLTESVVIFVTFPEFIVMAILDFRFWMRSTSSAEVLEGVESWGVGHMAKDFSRVQLPSWEGKV